MLECIQGRASKSEALDLKPKIGDDPDSSVGGDAVEKAPGRTHQADVADQELAAVDVVGRRLGLLREVGDAATKPLKWNVGNCEGTAARDPLQDRALQALGISAPREVVELPVGGVEDDHLAVVAVTQGGQESCTPVAEVEGEQRFRGRRAISGDPDQDGFGGGGHQGGGNEGRDHGSDTCTSVHGPPLRVAFEPDRKELGPNLPGSASIGGRLEMDKTEEGATILYATVPHRQLPVRTSAFISTIHRNKAQDCGSP